MQVVEIIEQAVTGLGFELVDFETSPRARLLRVFLDRQPGQGSVTIDDCALVSSHLTRLFAVEQVDYDRLEVSSPGLDRPLKRPDDWRRFAGEEVQLKVRMPIGNQRNFKARIGEVREQSVVVEAEGVARELAFENIEKARLVPKF